MPANSDTNSVGTLLKGFAIIEQLSSGQTSLSDIARRTGLPKSSTFRMLATLGELGIVSQSEHDDSYQLTAKLFEYGAKAINAFNLVEVSKSEMRLLRDQSGESVQIGVRSDTNVVCLHAVDSNYSLRMNAYVGMSSPLYTTSIGKTLIAWLLPEEVERIIEKTVFRRFTPSTITETGSFRAELAMIKENVFAFDNAEHEPGVVGIAVPVFDCYGEIAAAVNVTLPVSRYTPEKGEFILNALSYAGEVISKRIGCQAYPLAKDRTLPIVQK